MGTSERRKVVYRKMNRANVGKQMPAGLCSDIGTQRSSVLSWFPIVMGHPATGPPSKFFLAMLSLRCCRWAFCSCGAWRLISGCGAQASHHGGLSCCTGSRAHGPSSCGSRALELRPGIAAHGLSCPGACGIFLDQGSNPCPLHCKADS